MKMDQRIIIQPNRSTLILSLIVLFCTVALSQSERWQQRAEYKMFIDMDADKNQFNGYQDLKYYNNSPDTLHKIFYHLYFNAFQPNSMMDVNSLHIADPDPRIGKRISKLTPDQIGYHQINSFKMNGVDQSFEVVGTILEVSLKQPILPHSAVRLEMEFKSQVPLQIRRSGRDNKEGIRFSMSQWYPKLCEYDYQGWHANPYIAREFYGVWGDFDVKIKIGCDYIVGGTGILQNPEEIGYGYGNTSMKKKRGLPKKITYHFKAENVHDFVWAADPEYTHTTMKTDDGIDMHFFYQPDDKYKEQWERLPAIMNEVFKYANKTYGRYTHSTYAFIQGGDGGMEYPMATLITGKRKLRSLVGVSVHELMHSWYQMALGTNEALYAWMDEGFTSYASADIMNYLAKKGFLPGSEPEENPILNSVRGYANFTKSGREEALSTHADHFKLNTAYGVASYTKGAVFLAQIEYIIGEEAFKLGMLRYYNTWKYKHPNPNDFIRIMEKVSGLELDWYKEYFVYTIKTIDYAIDKVKTEDNRSLIVLKRLGDMPMPIELDVEDNDGKKYKYYIPLRIMRGEKAFPKNDQVIVREDWPWTHPTYTLELPFIVKNVQIDASEQMADVELLNNSWPEKE